MTMIQVPPRPRAAAPTSSTTGTPAAAAAAAGGGARSSTSSSRRVATASSTGLLRIRPSKSEWETNKPTIIRLYMDEDLSLKEVMHVMATQHGMRGTTYDTLTHSLILPLCSPSI